MEDATAPVREGDIIAGKYRVDRVLGVGGMGVVVAATHVNLEQRVALKFLLPAASQHPDVVARFAREARAAAKIQCDHVARVLDVDTLPTGAPYMVMEYMDGEDLERVLARRGPLPVDVTVSYILQACEALAEAHVLGIVHRDLKPANLFLANRPNGEPIVKVLDFGISKSTMTNSQAQLTKTSAIMGSPLYMSPEQMTSAKHVDIRSDIWAVGIVLYELLSGRTPFPAETMPELIAAILQRAADPVRVLRPDVPEALALVVDRCLEKDPSRRFANVAELASALAPFGPARSSISVDRISHVLGVSVAESVALGQGMRRSAANVTTNPTGPAVTHAEWSQSVHGSAGLPRRRTGVVAAVGVLGLVMALGVSAFFWLRSTPAVVASPLLVAVTAPTPTASAAPKSISTPTPAPPPPIDSTVALTPAATGQRPVHAPPHAPPRVATPRAAADCSTPFTIDAQGHRVPKPECL